MKEPEILAESMKSNTILWLAVLILLLTCLSTY